MQSFEASTVVPEVDVENPLFKLYVNALFDKVDFTIEPVQEEVVEPVFTAPFLQDFTAILIQKNNYKCLVPLVDVQMILEDDATNKISYKGATYIIDDAKEFFTNKSTMNNSFSAKNEPFIILSKNQKGLRCNIIKKVIVSVHQVNWCEKKSSHTGLVGYYVDELCAIVRLLSE